MWIRVFEVYYYVYAHHSSTNMDGAFTFIHIRIDNSLTVQEHHKLYYNYTVPHNTFIIIIHTN